MARVIRPSDTLLIMEIDSHAREKLFVMTPPQRLVAASLLTFDGMRLGAELRRLDRAGIDWLHIDIMDGRSVERFGFDLAVLSAIGASLRRPLPVQVHLMVEEPRQLVARFIEAGASNLTVHIEAKDDPAETLMEVRALGAQAGLALNPDTRFETVEKHLPMIDLLLVMSANPGTGNQPFIPETMQNVAKAARARRANGWDFRIQVEGGIDSHTAMTAIQSGADFLVAGSCLANTTDVAAAIEALREPAPGRDSGGGKP